MTALDYYLRYRLDGRAVIKGVIDERGECHPRKWITRVGGELLLCRDRPDYGHGGGPISPIGGVAPLADDAVIDVAGPKWTRVNYTAQHGAAA